MDFNRPDCNGQMHHLFNELDSNKVVILEFFMLNCGSCIYAGQDLTEMINRLDSILPEKLLFYHFGYLDYYSCTDIKDWVNTTGFNSVPFDSGAYQVAWYGGMGMPTVVVLGGTDHKVLFSNVGYYPGDTDSIANAVKDFYGISGFNDAPEILSTVNISPNPVNDVLNLSFQLKQDKDISIEITDLVGRKQKNVLMAHFKRGAFNKKIDISFLPSGFYFLRIESDGKEEYHKFMVKN